MGLLSKTVKTKWNSANKKHYESKGYKFTNWKDEFEVKVEDLSKAANVYVDIKCDCPDCKNPQKTIKFQNYLKDVREGGKYYCRVCAIKLFGKYTRMKTVLSNGNSFEKWCYNNLSKEESDNILSRWDYELNGCSPNEVGHASPGINNKGYYFKCSRGIHESELKYIPTLTSGKKKTSIIDCNKCNSFAQWGIDNLGEDFLEKYWDYDKNNNLGINPFEISYSSNKTIYIKCQDKDYHDSYDIVCSSFISGSRCSYCSGNGGRVHPLDSLGTLYPQAVEMWSDKNNKSPFEYAPHSQKRAWWKCPDGKHSDFKRSIHGSTYRDFRCPECVRERDESFLQEKVRLYLNDLNIYAIFHEHDCTIVPKNPKTNHSLPLDNEIKELKLIIEVHGIQHYKITGFHIKSAKLHNTTPKQELHYQQLKDRYKRIYIKKQGYFYLEIPYTADNKKETWKKLIYDKINEILKINKIKEECGECQI